MRRTILCMMPVVVMLAAVALAWAEEPEKSPLQQDAVGRFWSQLREVQWRTGLENQDKDSGQGWREVRFWVSSLNYDSKGSWSVSEDRLKTKIELVLRSAGLKPSHDASQGAPGLDVHVQVQRLPFSVKLHFDRPILYADGSNLYATMGAPWRISSLGTHGGDPEYIVQTVGKYVEEFANEYLKANQP